MIYFDVMIYAGYAILLVAPVLTCLTCNRRRWAPLVFVSWLLFCGYHGLAASTVSRLHRHANDLESWSNSERGAQYVETFRRVPGKFEIEQQLEYGDGALYAARVPTIYYKMIQDHLVDLAVLKSLLITLIWAIIPRKWFAREALADRRLAAAAHAS